MENKPCRKCGISFLPLKAWQAFCTPQHRDEWHCLKRKKQRLERKAGAVAVDPTASAEARL